jgi:hypothetical protein
VQYVIIDFPLDKKTDGNFNQIFYSENQWVDYVNHTSNAIWLTGFPDKPESITPQTSAVPIPKK